MQLMADNFLNHLMFKILEYIHQWASLLAQTVKNLLALWEILVQSLGWEDPLEKGMATHPSILAWRIPSIEEPGGYIPRCLKELDTTKHTAHLHQRYLSIKLIK